MLVTGASDSLNMYKSQGVHFQMTSVRRLNTHISVIARHRLRVHKYPTQNELIYLSDLITPVGDFTMIHVYVIEYLLSIKQSMHIICFLALLWFNIFSIYNFFIKMWW